MSYRLQTPYTDTQKADFIVEHNHNNGLNIENGTDIYNVEELKFKGDFLFALEANEIMAEIEVEIDVPDEVEEGEEQTYHKETTTVYKPIVDPSYDDKQAAKREARFKKEFFNTSLGWIRRRPINADGSLDDFLNNDLILFAFNLMNGRNPVLPIAYQLPDFTKELTQEYMVSLQILDQPITMQFIDECTLVKSNDFKPSNE